MQHTLVIFINILKFIYIFSCNTVCFFFIAPNTLFFVVLRKWNKTPRPQFNVKMPSYQYRKYRCGDKTVMTSSYLNNGISYTVATNLIQKLYAIKIISEPNISQIFLNYYSFGMGQNHVLILVTKWSWSVGFDALNLTTGMNVFKTTDWKMLLPPPPPPQKKMAKVALMMKIVGE